MHHRSGLLRAGNNHIGIDVLHCASRTDNQRASMFARTIADGRLLGFDAGDWSLLFGGFLLAGLLTLLA
jgi:hypothetical protein